MKANKLMLLVLFLVVGQAYGAPLLVRMAFNDADGNPSLVNRGVIDATATAGADTSSSTEVPPVNAGGHSFSFSGTSVNSVASMLNQPAVGNLRSFTIAAWVRVDSFIADNHPSRIMEIRTAASGMTSFNIVAANTADQGKLSFFRLSAGTVVANSALPLDTWRFVALTYDGTVASGNVKFYIGDGTTLTLDATHDMGASAIGAADQLHLANMGANLERGLHGNLDDVRLYGMYEGAGGALSQDQLEAIMQQSDLGAADTSWIPRGQIYMAHGPATDGFVRRYDVLNGVATAAGDVLTGRPVLRGMAVDADDNIHVAERDTQNIRKSAGLGLGQGAGSVAFQAENRPYIIAFRPGTSDTYVAEFSDHRVAWYNAAGTYQGELTGINNPHAVAFDGSDTLYVVYTTGIRRYDWDGDQWNVGWTNTSGWEAGRGVFLAGGRLYVLDGAVNTFLRVSRVDKATGTVLARWMGASNRSLDGFGDAYGNLYFAAWEGNRLSVVRLNDSGDAVDYHVLNASVPTEAAGIHGYMEFVPLGTVIIIK